MIKQCQSPYSSVVERQSCKLKVRSSILRGGISFYKYLFGRRFGAWGLIFGN